MKMITPHKIHIPTGISLAIVVFIITVSILASVIAGRREKRQG